MAHENDSNQIEEIAAIEQKAHDTLPPTSSEIYHGNSEIVVDIGSGAIKSADTSDLKLAKDGHTILIPQPSDDPHDPLNWSSTKKHLLLATIGLAAFIADFQAGSAVPCIITQGAE
ncbi:hypothetical protein LTR47_011282 [Exophiala xenobiotica]|nr:hypothetical protein LTR92_011209 [Exophiala xenobiotica]KAK5215423.1 hypothetical protein LTR72_011522 [Exophiala xenobiotica]KAK5220282.1 hypothetical protein LTR47_011282 [Exophiala xenobiotica]KAK5244339.1 hypothetical protein LTS06_010069 [Exophiala xenobiotica]KAK5260887.1 hypothetical protein LTR40_003284 [Exophiala xenobiotica]